MPTLRAFFASWSSLKVFVDDELVYDDDVMEGHIMYTERVRDEATRAIYADAARTSFYSPMNPSVSVIADPDATELHFVAHTIIPDENNFPPHTVWFHLNFRNVVDLTLASAVEPADKLAITWGRLKS